MPAEATAVAHDGAHDTRAHHRRHMCPMCRRYVQARARGLDFGVHRVRGVRRWDVSVGMRRTGVGRMSRVCQGLLQAQRERHVGYAVLSV